MALLTKVKTRLAIHAHRKVRGLLDGEYASVHTGRSMDFFDLREYVVGDEVKDLDWKASARNGELLVKRFTADRKHTVLLGVSTSQTMAGLCDLEYSKADIAVFTCGVLGWLAVRHGDRVGLVHGNAGGMHNVAPRTTEVDLERMLQTILDACDPQAPGPDLPTLLDHLTRTVRTRTILLLIIDDVELDEPVRASLKRLAAQHEVLLVTIGDLDPSNPALRDRALVDVAGGSRWPAFLHDPGLHADQIAVATERHRIRRKALDKLGIAGEHITSEDDVVSALFRLLERHRHGKR